MNKERMAYIAPTSELLVVRFEQNIMSFGVQGIEKGNDRSGADEDYEFI